MHHQRLDGTRPPCSRPPEGGRPDKLTGLNALHATAVQRRKSAANDACTPPVHAFSARPNPSLKPTRYGRPPCPCSRLGSSSAARASRPASAVGLARTLGRRSAAPLALLNTARPAGFALAMPDKPARFGCVAAAVWHSATVQSPALGRSSRQASWHQRAPRHRRAAAQERRQRRAYIACPRLLGAA
jgi:hypothetical protein